MKLANALSQRSELQTRIRQLEDRLDNNAQVQEGEQPAEDPMELLRELEAEYARLEELISAINRTNNATQVGDGTALSDLLARTLLNPRELPLGVVTSFIGSMMFIYIFYMSRKR